MTNQNYQRYGTVLFIYLSFVLQVPNYLGWTIRWYENGVMKRMFREVAVVYLKVGSLHLHATTMTKYEKLDSGWTDLGPSLKECITFKHELKPSTDEI